MNQKVFYYIEELERKAKESEKYFKLWHEEKIKNNKAIEHIENCHGMYRNTIGDIRPMINIKPVLDILKGVDKE